MCVKYGYGWHENCLRNPFGDEDAAMSVLRADLMATSWWVRDWSLMGMIWKWLREGGNESFVRDFGSRPWRAFRWLLLFGSEKHRWYRWKFTFYRLWNCRWRRCRWQRLNGLKLRVNETFSMSWVEVWNVLETGLAETFCYASATNFLCLKKKEKWTMHIGRCSEVLSNLCRVIYKDFRDCFRMKTIAARIIQRHDAISS